MKEKEGPKGVAPKRDLSSLPWLDSRFSRIYPWNLKISGSFGIYIEINKECIDWLS